MPGPLDSNDTGLNETLNNAGVKIRDLEVGQSSVNIFMQAKEVQFHIVIVCLFVCMFCVYIVTKC